jgi:O-antigen/teichoic acid export membrane protein
MAAMGKFTPIDAFSVIAIQAAVWAVILGFVCFTRLAQMRAVAASLARPANSSEAVFTAKFMKFAWSLPLLSLSGYAFMYGDRIMVAKYFPLREVGQYSYMFVLTTSVVVAAYSVYGTATYLYAVERFATVKSHDDLSRAAAHHIRLSLLFPVSFLPLVAIYSLFDQQIVRFLFGQAASVPPGCLSLLLLSSALNYGSQQLSSVSLLMKYQQRFLAPRWVLIAVFFVGLSVYHPSLYGVSVFVLCINIVQFLITGIIVYRAQTNESRFGALYT